MAQTTTATATDSGSRLIAAAKTDNLAEAESLLASGADPNEIEDGTGQSVLMLAAARGYVEIVKKLLNYRANPNLLDARAGASAIHKACQGGHFNCVQTLIEGGAFIDLQTTTTGHTPLVEAIWFTSDAIVEYLLGRNARIERTTYYGFTINQHIAYALMANQGRDAGARLNRIKQLVEARRAKDAATKNNPLLNAAQSGNMDDFRRAMAARPDLEALYPVIGTLDDGHTALLIAARNGYLEMVQALIAAGSNVNAVEPVFGAVPLHKATYNGHEKITEALVEAPGINLDYQGPSNGYTPLLDALWHGYAGCARILLAAGARKDIQGYDGLYPIDIAKQQIPGDLIIAELAI
jgi:ankyrin repeat protein